ncbi:MAG: hypothetical protein IH878_17665 [Gemmatimonadetes bacterium]|nr:hypothetical protein [Gemmatimonadota bacterium]
MHVRLWATWPWQMWKSGILLTSRRMYLRDHDNPTRTIDYKSAHNAVGKLERDTWFTKLTLNTSGEEFDRIEASDLKEWAEPFLELLQSFLSTFEPGLFDRNWQDK